MHSDYAGVMTPIPLRTARLMRRSDYATGAGVIVAAVPRGGGVGGGMRVVLMDYRRAKIRSVPAT